MNSQAARRPGKPFAFRATRRRRTEPPSAGNVVAGGPAPPSAIPGTVPDVTGVKLSAPDPRDAILDHILADYHLDPSMVNSRIIDLTASIDEPVGDQGPFPICVGEYTAALKAWQERGAHSNAPFNPFWTYNLRDDPSTDDGMTMRNALRILYKHGMATEASYPVHSTFVGPSSLSPLDRDIPPAALQEAARFKINAYGRINGIGAAHKLLYLASVFDKRRSSSNPAQPPLNALNDTMTPVFDAVSGLVNNGVDGGVIGIIIPVYNFDATPWKVSGPHDSFQGYHCVSLVGINPNTRILKLRNSWGVEVGDRGNFYMSFADWDECVLECWFATRDTLFAHLVLAHLDQRLSDLQQRQGDLQLEASDNPNWVPRANPNHLPLPVPVPVANTAPAPSSNPFDLGGLLQAMANLVKLIPTGPINCSLTGSSTPHGT